MGVIMCIGCVYRQRGCTGYGWGSAVTGFIRCVGA